MEVYWHHDARSGAVRAPADLGCLGLRIAKLDGKVVAPFTLPGGAATGLFMRENHATRPGGAPEGEYVFDYRVDPAMLAVAKAIAPTLARCGPKAAGAAGGAPDPKLCVGTQPRVVVGGRGVSGTAFLANPAYRTYLFEQLGAQTVDMETASLAHVAYVNGIPYIAFRSLSDLAGAENESALTLAFLAAWSERQAAHGAAVDSVDRGVFGEPAARAFA